jgi:hypothetical protein
VNTHQLSSTCRVILYRVPFSSFISDELEGSKSNFATTIVGTAIAALALGFPLSHNHNSQLTPRLIQLHWLDLISIVEGQAVGVR